MYGQPANLYKHLNLLEYATIQNSEGSIVRYIGLGQDYQLTGRLIREVLTVGELVAPLLHGYAGPVTLAGELVQVAHS